MQPLVGRLACGEQFLFAGVHELMYLEQLHDRAAAFESASADRWMAVRT